MGNQNYIVINGKKYDAVTGKLLTGSAPVDASKNTIKQGTPKPATGVVDGFHRPKKHKTSHATINHAQKSQQRSQTLARKAVHKPTSTHTKQVSTKPGLEKRTLGTSARRAYMAKEVHKSPLVQKFGEAQVRSSVVKKHVTAPVKQAPTQQAHHTTNHNIHNHTSNSRHNRAPNSMVEQALTHAQSHTEKPPKTRKRGKLAKKLGVSRRTLSISSAALAGALLIGFFAMQNVPNLSMRIAASRAGFDAHLPSYTPSGFSFKGPINYEPGRVTITFKANADNRSYALTQQSSNWNSDALVANFIEPEQKQYQTYLDRGRTLYIYDGSNATWIDDGIWYQVEGDSGMTTDQLIRIAASI